MDIMILGGIETGDIKAMPGIITLIGIHIRIIILGTWGFIVRIITNPIIMGMQTLSETTTTDIIIATTEIEIMEEELLALVLTLITELQKAKALPQKENLQQLQEETITLQPLHLQEEEVLHLREVLIQTEEALHHLEIREVRPQEEVLEAEEIVLT